MSLEPRRRYTRASLNDLSNVFPGDSDMARRMRAFDWTLTPLGAPALWPNNLRTSVRIILTSRHPMFVWWGEELINLYNDGYAHFLHSRHPAALGRPAAAVWPEVWHEIGPRAELARRQDAGTYDEALPFILLRKGYPEETYVTFSYSPIPDDGGGFGGILCPVIEDTQRIIGERQLALLRDLAARTADARSPHAACTFAIEALAANPADVPFALIYLLDGNASSPRLEAHCGFVADHEIATERLSREHHLWPIANALTTRRHVLVSDLSGVTAWLPVIHGSFRPEQAIVIPLPIADQQTSRRAVLVAGLNPLRRYNDDYKQFMDLIVNGVAVGLNNAQAYDAERQRAEALARLDRAKTEFFHNLSHEFRTPLTLMIGPLEEELQRAGASERLTIVHRNALRLLKLVNTLLEFSRIEAGRLEATYQATDLAALTTDLASVFRSAVEKAGLSLRIDCPRLPEPVYVAPEMWETIVLNLISNAFKFTFEGEIAIAVHARGSDAELTVRDTGVGIPRSEVPRVFERFHRVPDTRSRTHEGSGIGLALVRELVKLLGGGISVASTVGQGTTFTVTVPFGTRHLPAGKVVPPQGANDSGRLRRSAFVDEAELWLPDSEATRQPETTPGTAAVGTRARIVLADDNSDLRHYVTGLLGTEYEVIAVHDGDEALAVIHEQLPDLVLADVMMPGLDGFELVARLRADRVTARLPIILLTARAGEESRIEGISHGADDYLVKPFSARELLARVRTHLTLSRVRADAERVLQTSRDALEQRVHERTGELRAIEEKLAALFDALPIGVALLDADGEPVLTNAAMLRFLPDPGMPSRNSNAEPRWHAWHPDGRPLEPDEFPAARALRGERAVPGIEMLYTTEEGEDIWTRVATVPLRDQAGGVAGAIVTLTDINELKRLNDQLEDRVRERTTEINRLFARLVTAQEEERRRIARDIHDQVGQVMTALRMNLEALQWRAAGQESLAEQTRRTLRLAEELDQNIDFLTWHLRPATLELGLTASLAHLVTGWSQRFGIAADVDAPPDNAVRLPRDAEANLYRVVQEALHNVVKHSDATHVTVVFDRHDEELVLVIEDNGRGFDVTEANRPEEGASLGLVSMRERATLAGGRLEIESTPNVGTSIFVRVPLKQEELS